MAPRGRQHRKNMMVGNTRMDAALDSMRQYGFDEQVVRETIDELLDVYEGTQGWPFIEEAAYRLLIETLLGKQQTSAGEKEDPLQDHARRVEIAETSSAATATTGITEVGSSSLVAQDTLFRTSDGVDSASQTNDQDPASLGNETVVKKSTVPVEKGLDEQGIRVEYKKRHVDNVSGSSNSTFVSNVESTFVRTRMIESSKSLKNPPCRTRKPCYGWIGNDDEEVELMTFPLPPLPEHIKKLIGQSEAPQSGRRRRRKSRWDEKPDDM